MLGLGESAEVLLRDSAESLESLCNSALDSVCDSVDSTFLLFALLGFLDL